MDDGTPRATSVTMDRTIPLPAHSTRSTAFVRILNLAAWKHLRQIKGWRAFGKCGMVITVGFAASPGVMREMAREAMKGWGHLSGVGWCVVRSDLAAQ